jgi:Cu(I)/Ag(I) efflux system membrane protein CusA/SilA
MMGRVTGFCARRWYLVLALALAAAVAGEASRRDLAADAIPDLAEPRIGVVIEWMGHAADEVSTCITQVMTSELAAVPGSRTVRGTSMAGMAFLEVVFPAARALDRGREEIGRRIGALRPRLPAGARVSVGPAASSTGWVLEYALVDRRGVMPLAMLRRLQEDVVRPTLATLPGVAEVATAGGGAEALTVKVDRARLAAAGLALTDLVAPLRAAAMGSVPPPPGALEALVIRAPTTDPAAEARAGTVTLGELGRVVTAPEMPIGLVDFGGNAAVAGIVVAHQGADPGRVLRAVKSALEGVRARLPEGVDLVPFADRSELAAHVEGTLGRALVEEIAVVVLLTLAFLCDVRSAVVPLLTLPVVLALTFLGMRLGGIAATVMSFGGIGIALGMAVDADIVALEACHRWLDVSTEPPGGGGGAVASGRERRARLAAATAGVVPAVLTSLLIAALSFLPVLAFDGETGRLLRPLVLGKTLVVAAAALVTVTVAPALRDRLLPRRTLPELGNPLTRVLVRAYRPFVHFALRRPLLTLGAALLAVLSCVPLLPLLGGEFFPRVDEGNLLFMPTTLPGVMPEEAAEQLRRQDQILMRFPEVRAVLGKAGRADTATDPAPLSMIETVIELRPRAVWPTRVHPGWYARLAPSWLSAVLGRLWPQARPATTEELVAELDQATRLPGWTNAWTTPVRARLDMMSTGVRTPVGVRVVGGDLLRIETLAAAAATVLSAVPGTRNAAAESAGGQTWLSFAPDARAVARLAADPAAVRAGRDLALSDGLIGVAEGGLAEGGRRGRALRLLFDPPLPRLADRLREVTVRAGPGAGRPTPLEWLGRDTFSRRPAVVRSERGEQVAYVYVDLESGTDVVGYLKRARQAIAAAIADGRLALAPGERIEWTGQYELIAASERRLLLVVPLVLLSMLGLLYLQFRSLTEGFIVLSSVPFALVGSVWTLFLLDYPLSMPVWVGLLSVVGLAMQTGVVMVVYIDQAFHRRVQQGRIESREDIVAAHAEGCVQRLRPKLMTVTTMAAGLLPLLWADGAGAEIIARVAAPMLGGLATSAFLTLEVLPVLYTMWRHRQLLRARRAGVPLVTIVGKAPPWARV